MQLSCTLPNVGFFSFRVAYIAMNCYLRLSGGKTEGHFTETDLCVFVSLAS